MTQQFGRPDLQDFAGPGSGDMMAPMMGVTVSFVIVAMNGGGFMAIIDGKMAFACSTLPEAHKIVAQGTQDAFGEMPLAPQPPANGEKMPSVVEKLAEAVKSAGDKLGAAMFLTALWLGNVGRAAA